MRSVSYLKVQDHNGLVRDNFSGAILAVDDNEYEVYRAKREVELARHRMIENQVKEINEIKSEMLEIKQMLSLLLKGK